VVIAILGILATIAVPRFTGFNERARIAADQATVRTLNSVTPIARLNISASDPFIDENKTDEELIEFLEDGGYLNSAVAAQSKDATFKWLTDNEKWYLMFEDSFYVIGLMDGLTIHSNGMLGAWNGSEEYSGSSKDIIIPTSLNGLVLTNIGQNTFRNKGLVALAFEDGSQIKQIHARAFYNNNLSSIDFPETLESIDLWAFRDNNLTEIKLPPNLHTIQQRAFDGNSLEKITIGSNVSIGDRAFGENTETFIQAYESGGSGTYTWNGNNWFRQGD
jgi:hypothetical protein